MLITQEREEMSYTFRILPILWNYKSAEERRTPVFRWSADLWFFCVVPAIRTEPACGSLFMHVLRYI